MTFSEATDDTDTIYVYMLTMRSYAARAELEHLPAAQGSTIGPGPEEFERLDEAHGPRPQVSEAVTKDTEFEAMWTWKEIVRAPRTDDGQRRLALRL